jgi:hypothetical protein
MITTITTTAIIASITTVTIIMVIIMKAITRSTLGLPIGTITEGL